MPHVRHKKPFRSIIPNCNDDYDFFFINKNRPLIYRKLINFAIFKTLDEQNGV